MQIQVNANDHVSGSDSVAERVKAEIEAELDRFADQITRVEVHLSDTNKAKAGENDKRCLMEVRLTGRQPIAVTNFASTVAEAYTGAVQKVVNHLETTLGRLRDVKGAPSIRDNPLR